MCLVNPEISQGNTEQCLFIHSCYVISPVVKMLQHHLNKSLYSSKTFDLHHTKKERCSVQLTVSHDAVNLASCSDWAHIKKGMRFSAFYYSSQLSGEKICAS